jgi:drug/metabolite transporter (DMT)-like permease
LSFAGLVAPFEYSALVFSIFWGIIILDEFLNLLSIIGILIILVSGVLIAVRETIKDRPLSLKKILDRR